LLPPNSTPLERALADVSARISNIPVQIASIWTYETCPAALLPWFAAALSVDVWHDDWPDETKRLAISTSLELHRRKGTISAVRTALESAGHGDATIVERVDYRLRDGTSPRDGTCRRGGAGRWATFSVILNRPTSAHWAEQIRARITHAQRLSCELVELRYAGSGMVRDGTTPRDGTHLRAGTF
jgi:phage tail P2-like protein